MRLSVKALPLASVGVIALSFLSSIALAGSPAAGAVSSAPQPIAVTILKSSPRATPGLVFLTPNGPATGARGTEIVDNRGRPVWFSPLPSSTSAYDFRVQRYRHEPVLTWIESEGGFSTGPTKSYIADRHYNVIATVSAGHGLTQDIHEFHLTPEGTALITAYRTVPRDLSAVGGPSSGLVTEGVVQEVEIESGRVVFEWHSLDHIGLDESHAPVSTSPTQAWDYFHLNAVSVDEDGNLLIGARNAWAAYRVDRHSGAVLFRLGGTKSDFALGRDVAFAWQHNPTAADDHGLIRIFDNEASPNVLPYSRVIWVRHDDVRKTATLERWLKHPDGLSAGSQGNAQALENGDTFVGWGALPRFSEFDREGELLFDAALPPGYNTYRAYRYEWVGEPDTRPTAIAARNPDGSTTVDAVWNGATRVARWDVVDAFGHGREVDPDRERLSIVASQDWNGLDTAIPVDAFVESVVVLARDREGRVIGRSAAVAVNP
jgi:hypothetical protein